MTEKVLVIKKEKWGPLLRRRPSPTESWIPVRGTCDLDLPCTDRCSESTFRTWMDVQMSPGLQELTVVLSCVCIKIRTRKDLCPDWLTIVYFDLENISVLGMYYCSLVPECPISQVQNS